MSFGGSPLSSAELFNPSTGSWTLTGSMTTPRYNPSTGTWTATGSMNTAGFASLTLLGEGKVLAIGESIGSPSKLYDPSTGTWSATGSTGTTILALITSLLPSGDVFVTGGFISGKRAYSTASLYDPSTGQFTLENGPCSCTGFNGAVRQTGKVLAAVGMIVVNGSPYPSQPELLDSRLLAAGAMSAQDVAEIGYDALVAGKAVVIPGVKNKVLAWSTRFAPRSSLVKISRWMLEPKKASDS